MGTLPITSLTDANRFGINSYIVIAIYWEMRSLYIWDDGM